MDKNGYKKLVVWQKAIDLTVNIYRLTERLPSEEKYGLTSQMRRCAVSIASNLAEGSKRATDKDFRNFVLIALGSSAELETQLIIVERLKLVDDKRFGEVLMELDAVMKMLNKLQLRLRG